MAAIQRGVLLRLLLPMLLVLLGLCCAAWATPLLAALPPGELGLCQRQAQAVARAAAATRQPRRHLHCRLQGGCSGHGTNWLVGWEGGGCESFAAW